MYTPLLSIEPSIPVIPTLAEQKYRTGQTQILDCKTYMVYRYDVIPVNLMRKRTNTTHRRNYFPLDEWFKFMTLRDAADKTDILMNSGVKKCDEWFICGLMTSHADSSILANHLNSNKIKKQMLCKLISEDTIVCAFNIIESDKRVSITDRPQTSLNVFFKNKLVFIQFDYSVYTVEGTGYIEQKVKRILLCDTASSEIINLTKESDEENSNLMNIISQKSLYVMDPNIVEDVNTRVEWFGESGGMVISEMNNIVDSIMLRINTSASAAAVGGRRKFRKNKITTNIHRPKYKKTKKRRYNKHSNHSNHSNHSKHSNHKKRSKNNKLKHNKSKKSVRT